MSIKIRYSSPNIFLQFEDGEYILQECSKETALQIFELAQNPDCTKESIFVLLDTKFQELVQEVEQIKQSNQLVLDLVESVITDNRFYLQDNKLFRVGIPVSIPALLATKIQECVQSNNQDELNKLDKFWAWCSLIRNSDSRESFYGYIEKNNLLITKNGIVVGFRKADYVGKEENKDLQEFVTQEYLRLRKNKKSTNVNVYEDEDGEYTLKPTFVDEVYENENKNDLVGNLKELYFSFGEMEDAYESRTSGINGKLKYRIGVETRMNDNEVDWSNTECSRGIHLHSGRYIDSGYGDTRLAVAFNPMDLVRAPYNDQTKLRVLAITPIAVIKEIRDFQMTPEIEEIVDEMFTNHIQRLDSLIKEGKFAPADRTHTLITDVPKLDLPQLLSVIKTTVSTNAAKDRLVKL